MSEIIQENNLRVKGLPEINLASNPPNPEAKLQPKMVHMHSKVFLSFVIELLS